MLASSILSPQLTPWRRFSSNAVNVFVNFSLLFFQLIGHIIQINPQLDQSCQDALRRSDIVLDTYSELTMIPIGSNGF